MRIAIPLPGQPWLGGAGFPPQRRQSQSSTGQPDLGGADDHPQPRRHGQVGEDRNRGRGCPATEYLATGWMASRSPAADLRSSPVLAVAGVVRAARDRAVPRRPCRLRASRDGRHTTADGCAGRSTTGPRTTPAVEKGWPSATNRPASSATPFGNPSVASSGCAGSSSSGSACRAVESGTRDEQQRPLDGSRQRAEHQHRRLRQLTPGRNRGPGGRRDRLSGTSRRGDRQLAQHAADTGRLTHLISVHEQRDLSSHTVAPRRQLQKLAVVIQPEAMGTLSHTLIIKLSARFINP